MSYAALEFSQTSPKMIDAFRTHNKEIHKMRTTSVSNDKT